MREEGLPPVGIYRLNQKLKSKKILVLDITKLVKSTDIKKSKTAHKNLLKLGRQISRLKNWKIRGGEVKTFLKDRSDVV